MRALVLSLLPLLIAPFAVAADPPAVSYVKDVKPFLAKYCFECHSAKVKRGGLDLETYAAMIKGGQSFNPVKPGKPEDSVLVTMSEGRFSPVMPPKTAKVKPTKDEVALLRAWVASGAKDDSAAKEAVPASKTKAPVNAPVSAAAYRPDGKLLVAGGRKEVFLIDPMKGDVLGRLTDLQVKVTAVAFSRDGKSLAVASSTPGVSGEVRLYTAGADGKPNLKPTHVLPAHADQVHGAAFSPDGKLLATCGYDRLIKLWDVATGKEVRALTDHSDAVYAVAFSPDGKLLASGSADRAVKIWETSTGKRLLTLGDSIDWVYTLCWSPDGKRLAAAGVDKSIRVWDVTPAEASLVHAVFAHEGPVLHVAYSADGKFLYSLSEDKTAKAWAADTMTERTVYPKQPEAPLALAVRPDHKQLAVGRFDGALVLLNEADGKVQSQPLPPPPPKPEIKKLSPASTPRGRTVVVTFEGKELSDVTEATADVAGVTIKLLGEGRSPNALRAEVVVPANTAAGPVKLAVNSPAGTSGMLPLIVDLFPETKVVEPNNSPSTGQPITLPATVGGNLANAGDVDCFRFDATAGQELGVQVVTAAVGSKMEPVLQLTDLTGRVLAETTNGLLGHAFEKEGSYALTVRDKDYRGGADFTYRLHVGDIPVVTSVFPLGVTRGRESAVTVSGVHLGPQTSVKVTVPADAAVGSKVPVVVTTPKGTPLGSPTVVVGEFPEAMASAQPLLPVPGTGNGRVETSGPLWKFAARKGQPLIVEVNARRLGSPLDSVIEILDAKGRPVPRAALRATAKTYVVFRDHDSATGGIRIEAWNELAMNDYLFVGTELIRIKALPLNPDADCNFFTVAGQRVGYLDTTPTHHSLGTPMYKVAIHPPGTTFPPNGLPVFNLNYSNDDGGPGFGKDSRLTFDPPADGEYQVRVTDARGLSGAAYAYRLTVRPPQASFKVSFDPKSPAVWRGGALPINVTAERIDGYDGPIAVKLTNLPPGYSAPETTVPAGETTTTFALFADASADAKPGGESLKLEARATINGSAVVREAVGGLPTAVDPGEIVTTVEQSEFSVKPGQRVTVKVTIERRNGFKGRVPLDVKGLPHGVRVLDIGLSGVLITERETSRSFVIYAEPWVQPQEHPFVVLAKREGKNTEHAAKTVLLKVTK